MTILHYIIISLAVAWLIPIVWLAVAFRSWAKRMAEEDDLDGAK